MGGKISHKPTKSNLILSSSVKLVCLKTLLGYQTNPPYELEISLGRVSYNVRVLVLVIWNRCRR